MPDSPEQKIKEIADALAAKLDEITALIDNDEPSGLGLRHLIIGHAQGGKELWSGLIKAAEGIGKKKPGSKSVGATPSQGKEG